MPTEKSLKIMRAQRRKKIKAVEALGGKCSICGYDRCINALEFHHIEGKEEKPSYIIMRWSWDRVMKELEKCILVCSNCHREIHYQDLDASIQIELKPFIEKICPQCNQKYHTKNEDQKFCSSFCNSFTQRKVERPSKEELKLLLDEKTPYVQIGKMFGVTGNAIKKWAQKYELV